MGSSRQTHQKMEQGLTYLALVLSLVSGGHSYYPNLLGIASSHNRLVFNKNYGQDLTDNNQTGNWTSPGGCIVATMTMVLSVPTNTNDASKMIDISADPSKNITVTGKCPKNATTQELTLSWKDEDKIDKNNTLDRNITMVFMKNVTTSTYGISELKGTVEVRVVNQTNTTFVDLSGTFSPLLLETPVNKSYTCPSDSPINLKVTWHGSGNPSTTTTTTTTTTTKKTTTTTKKITTTTKKTTTTTKKTTTTTKPTTTTTKPTTTTTKSTTTTTKSTTTTTKPTTTTTKKSTTTTPYSNHTTPSKTTTTTTTVKTTASTSKPSNSRQKIVAMSEINKGAKNSTTTTKKTTTTTKKTTTTTKKTT